MNGCAVFVGIHLRQKASTLLISCTSHVNGNLHWISCMSCYITDVEFLLEVISDLIWKTCRPLGYLQSPAFLKNPVSGHAKVVCEME